MLIKGKILIKFTCISGWERVGMLEHRDKIKNYLPLEIRKKRKIIQPNQMQPWAGIISWLGKLIR